jgi:23S rRNA pseudouridine955/2504/2580 synthase
MNEVHYKTITQEEVGQRLDNYLVRILKGVPKSHIYRIIRSGEVRINKKRAKPLSRLAEGDLIRIPPVRCAESEEVYVGQSLMDCLRASILFEDAGLLVVNKPSGIAVHGGSGLSLGMIEAMRKIRTDLTYLELVHRLDKETSGCLLFAKKRSVLRAIQAALAAREVSKTYWALLAGAWQGRETVVVHAALEKNTMQSGERMVRVSEEGKASETRFQLLENYPLACWVEATPKTGRTHQIRVHSAHLGHPILGDQKYGKSGTDEIKKAPHQRLYLHARAIRFTLNGITHQFQADVDDKFAQALSVLRLSEEQRTS